MTASKKVFISKPATGSQGDGLKLITTTKDISSKDVNLAQEYVAEPLLVDGLKFDLRVYVTIVGSGKNIMAYICDEGLARFCTVPYEYPNQKNFKDEYMHFTNYSVNKSSPAYVKLAHDTSVEEILSINSGTKRTLTSMYKSLERDGIDSDEVKASIA